MKAEGVDQQKGSGGQTEQMKAEQQILQPSPSLFMPAAFYVAVQQLLHVPPPPSLALWLTDNAKGTAVCV